LLIAEITGNGHAYCSLWLQILNCLLWCTWYTNDWLAEWSRVRKQLSCSPKTL